MPLVKKIEKRYTYADYITWPDDERWEIIDYGYSMGTHFSMGISMGTHPILLGCQQANGISQSQRAIKWVVATSSGSTYIFRFIIFQTGSYAPKLTGQASIRYYSGRT